MNSMPRNRSVSDLESQYSRSRGRSVSKPTETIVLSIRYSSISRPMDHPIDHIRKPQPSNEVPETKSQGTMAERMKMRGLVGHLALVICWSLPLGHSDLHHPVTQSPCRVVPSTITTLPLSASTPTPAAPSPHRSSHPPQTRSSPSPASRATVIVPVLPEQQMQADLWQHGSGLSRRTPP